MSGDSSLVTADALPLALGNRDESLRLLDKYDAAEALLDFVKLGWESVEPGNAIQVPWSLEVICEHLQAVTEGEIKRLLINVPPGFSKSMSTNVFWPSWEWGPKGLAHYRYISAAHEQGLSIRDMVRARDLMLSEWYQSMWGGEWDFKSDANAKLEYHNDKTGFRKASSTGSGLTGYRGDRIILDDPHAVRDLESEAEREDALRWFSETLPTRLNKQAESAIVVIMQRIHERDVSGLILKEDLGYEHVCLPMEFEHPLRCFTSYSSPRHPERPVEKVARLKRDGEAIPRWVTEEELANEVVEKPLAPEDRLGDFAEKVLWDDRTEDEELLDPIRFPREAVEALKKTFRAWGGTYAEAGQLQQRPSPRGGGMFQRKDFQYIDKAPLKVKWIRGYDLASTKEPNSPWSVGCKLGLDGDGRVIIADVDRRRATPGEVDQMMKQLAEQDGKNTDIDFPQDPGQAGVAQKTHIVKLLSGWNAWSSPESGSKEDRAKPLAAQAEGLNLYLVRGPWNDAFVNEACSFPNGEFKDQVDAASRAYARANRKKPRRLPISGGKLIEG